MKAAEVYVDLDGHDIPLTGLDTAERRLVARLRRRARTHPDWTDFDNYWMRALVAFYDARGVPRSAVKKRAPFRIAQDLSGRLGIASGLVRPDDYRSELADLIREQFPSRRAFCEATGLAEDALSAFLAGRQDLPLDLLNEALERIGYRLHIIPAPRKKTG